MFNNYYGGDTKTNVTNNLKINAVSGGIYKTYRESWFKRFNLKSPLMDMFSDHSCVRYYAAENEYLIKDWRYEEKYKNAKPVTIIQMVICGDMEVIAEIMYTEDLDKHLTSEVKDNE